MPPSFLIPYRLRQIQKITLTHEHNHKVSNTTRLCELLKKLLIVKHFFCAVGIENGKSAKEQINEYNLVIYESKWDGMRGNGTRSCHIFSL